MATFCRPARCDCLKDLEGRPIQMTKILATWLLSGVSIIALGPAFAADSQGQPPAQDSSVTPPTHHHKPRRSDRLDLLEKQVELQAQAIKQQSEEIQALKSQLGQGPAPVTAAQFADLQSKVDEEAAAKKDQPVV